MHKNKYWLIFIVIFSLGVALRFFFIGKGCLGAYDLTFIRVSKFSFKNMLAGLKYFDHQLLFLLILQQWVKILGEAQFFLRLLPALFNIISIALIYIFGKKVFSREVGLWGAFILAFSPVHIYLSRVISPYLLFVLLSLLSSFSLMLVLEKKQKRYIIPYLASNIFLVYTHLCAFIVILAQALYILIFRREHARKVLISQVAAIIFYLPWAFLMLPYQIRSYVSAAGVFYPPVDPPPPSLESVFRTFKMFSYNKDYLLVIFLVFIFWGLIRNKNYFTKSLFNLLMLILPPLVLYIISLTIIPVYKQAPLLFVSVPFYLLVSEGISSLRTAGKVFAALIILFSAFSTLSTNSFMSPGGNWQELVRDLNKSISGNDIVLAHPGVANIAFEYYFKKTNRVFYIASREEAKEALSRERPRAFFIVIRSPVIDKELVKWCDRNYLLVRNKEYPGEPY